MRTDEEILARIEAVTDEDWMGTTRANLIIALSFEAAKSFLTEEAVANGPAGWAEHVTDTDEKVLKAMTDYMDFAVGKAVGHRGLSAGRSIDHYRAWVWLLGDEHFDAIDWENYTNYGAPILAQIAERYDIPVPADDDFVNMSKGLPCEPKCYSGCGA